MRISKYNSRLTEQILRFEKEGAYLERKGRDTRPSKVADVLIGMLNAGGGTLAYGIADDGTVEDLNQDGGFLSGVARDLDQYRKVVHDFIKPPANIEFEEVYLSGGEMIFLYHVDQDHERLFQRNDSSEAVYLRVADSNKGPLSRDEVRKLEYNKGIRSFENEVREDFDPVDLDRSACEAFRAAMRYGGSFEELAVKRSLAVRRGDGYAFKNAAVLLFAEDPDRYVPNASVRYVRYDGTELKPGSQFNVVKDQRFEGPIPALIKRLETFMEASLRDYYYLDIRQGRFLRVPEFPKDAWLEGIVNALCHRSYNIQGNPVMIRHFDDRLEIANSGPLPAQVTVENIASERFARNARIARTLAELGYVRELNEGVPRIYAAMRELTLAKPEYADDGTTVTLTLRNKVSEHKETILADVVERIEDLWGTFNETERKLIYYLFENQEAMISEMVPSVGMSEQAVRYNLKKLEELLVLERVSVKIRDPKAIYRFKSS